MTLFEWMSASWRGATRVPAPTPSVVPSRVPGPRVAAEYLSLYTYLDHRYASMVVLTFEQMEALLGFALPERARTETDWWTGTALRADWHSSAWTVARRTATPNLLARTVAFERLP